MVQTQNEFSLIILNKIISQIDDKSLQLASIPDVIIKINAVLDDERKNMNDVAAVVQHDVSLTTRIIQIANSPALRVSGDVTSVADAIRRLGVVMVKNLAVCVCLKDKMKTTNVLFTDLLEQEIDLSFKLSAYGSAFTKMVEKVKPETLLMAGIVGHIGHLVVLRFISESVLFKDTPKDEVIYVMNDIGPVISDVILKNWDFPKNIRDAMMSDTPANTDEPSTAHDIYTLANKFIAGELTEERMAEVQAFVDENLDEIKAIESLFA